MELAGTIALVTGGSRGIGRAVALELARRGADVAINYNSNSAAADEVVAAITALGRTSVAIQGNVGDYASAGNLVKEAKEALEGKQGSRRGMHARRSRRGRRRERGAILLGLLQIRQRLPHLFRLSVCASARARFRWIDSRTDRRHTAGARERGRETWSFP